MNTKVHKNGFMLETEKGNPPTETCPKKPRCCLTGCLLIVVACFIAVLWMFGARLCWWVGGKNNDVRMAHDRSLDLSGEYLAEIKKARAYSMSMAHPFLPDSLDYSNALVAITQHGRTNMTVVSQSLRMRGKAETNSIAISGWVWRWGDNRLEYARTAIGPGLGMGIFPGVLKYKSRCCVAAMPTIGSARQTLRVNLVNELDGLLFFAVPWSEPEDSSEIILTPISNP